MKNYYLKHYSVLIILVFFFGFTACSDDDESKSIEVTEEQELNQTIYAEGTEGNSGITFTTNGAWTSSIVETTQKSTGNTQSDWVSISPDNGNKAGTYTISISLSPNYTGADRSSTITIVCGNDKIEIKVTQTGKTATGEIPEENDDVDIYVAGEDGDRAVYWKNGNKVVLSNLSSEANSIFVSGSDVYVAGREWGVDGSSAVSCYWKNGQRTSLSAYSVNSIFVSGNDVYVAGTISGAGYNARYWKNGKEMQLDGKGYDANSVFVSGNDVYVAGGSYSISGEYDIYNQQACYWKNGQQIVLDESRYCPVATSIFVSGNDVYVASDGGYNEDKQTCFVRYWKNGKEVIVEESDSPTHRTSLFVSGNDVYMAGAQRSAGGGDVYIAKYWKNREAIILTDYSDSDPEEEASSIYVVDNDVYVAGSVWNSKTESLNAVYWKNGKIVKLGNSDYSEANSIFVVKK